jgi:cytochrome P460
MGDVNIQRSCSEPFAASSYRSLQTDGRAGMPDRIIRTAAFPKAGPEDLMARSARTFLRYLFAGPLVLLLAAIGTSAAGLIHATEQGGRDSQSTRGTMPQYDEAGALRLPAGYRQWVFAGSSLGLSYAEGQAGMEMFHETLMEPTAYQHFVETGTFREGTMLALIVHGIGENTLPARRGRFAADVHGVEMAVKDSSHRPEGWAYYNFGGMNGVRNTAPAMPKESCYNCHAQHAKRDNVFLQYYTMLAEAAKLPTK